MKSEQMAEPVKLLLAAGIGILGVLGLSKMASGTTTMTLVPGVRYYFDYSGPRKLLPLAIGLGWSNIYIIDIWSAIYGDWIPPADPVNYYLETGSQCAIEVIADIVLSGFVYKGQEAI